MSMFQKATKRAVRARIALDGPSGSGKTWTALTFAAVFGNRTAVVDTERGSASLYADRFDFDVIELSPPYHPQRLIDIIHAAEKEHYDTLVVDSGSHFWEGEGGTLDLVDAAAARAQGNTWAGWKTGTPILRDLIDAMLASDLHIVFTMRSKTEWVLEEKQNRDGKTVTTPKRVGMAPVMRAGMEYEFTLVGDLDLEHRLTISKSRVDVLADQIIQPGKAGEAAEAFMAWMETGSAMATREQIDGLIQALNKIEPKDVRVAAKQEFADQFGNPQYLLAEKVAAAQAFIAGSAGAPPPPPPPDDDPDGRPFDDTPPIAPEAVDDAQLAGTSSTRSGERPPATTVTQGHQEGASLGDPETKTPQHRGSHRRGARSPGEALHRLLGGMKFSAEDQKDLIFAESNGRTIHASELTDAERAMVITRAEAITDGAASLTKLREICQQKRDEQLNDQLEQSIAGQKAVDDFDKKVAS